MTDAMHRMQTGPRMSKIVRYGGLIFLAGQTSGGTDIADIVGQAREVFGRIDGLLAEAGSNRSRLLSATIYLRDMSDFAAMNAEWESWMPEGAAPARTTVEAKMARADLLIEVAIIAASLHA